MRRPSTHGSRRSLIALAPASAVPSVVSEVAAPDAAPPNTARKIRFPSELLDSVVLNGAGSTKETLHLEFSLAGSGMTYVPGDALAVLPVNAPDIVQAVLDAAKLGGDEEIETKSGGRKRLADALREDFDITALSRNVLDQTRGASPAPHRSRNFSPTMRRSG